jgi:hypothetical protein
MRQLWEARMEGQELQGTDKAEMAQELQAALQARRELGPEVEDELIGAFLDRIDHHIDVRVQRQLESLAPRTAAKSKQDSNDVEVISASLALAIPLMVVAGIWGSAIGVIAVVAGLVIIHAFRYVDRWV